jgi:hypothetical protein
LGVHECTRECCCHPTVQGYVFNRTLVLHKDTAN